VLANCTTRLVDPGPYKFAEKVDWSEVHVGDRLYAVLRIRMLTYKRPYVFRVHCEECREPFDWQLDLAKLPVKPLPPAALDAMKGDRLLSAKWPELDDREVTFRLLIGKDEAKNRRIARQRPKELALVSLLARVVRVEGVEEKDRVDFLTHLGAEAMIGLIALMDERDGGVDTDIEVVCDKPECGVTQEVRLPFGRAFWLPKARKTTLPLD
jgi:hypothetical protein